MLRELPPHSGRRADDEMVIDVPGVERDEGMQAQAHSNDLLDDVFGSAPASPVLDGAEGRHLEGADRAGGQELSEIPRLRSTHVTNGYREGIAASKEQCIQEGFDEGYSLGAELGLMAGRCLGALEGICRALAVQKAKASAGAGASEQTGGEEEPAKIFERAQDEMMIQKLFGRDFFGADGIWLYDVPGQEDETTFRAVALEHPVLKSWIKTTTDLKGKICP